MSDIYDAVSYRRFRPYVVGNARLETLHTRMRWVEGQGASVYREPSKRPESSGGG